MNKYFCHDDEARKLLQGKRVAVVASGPGAAANPIGLVDSFDVVVRVNNYKLTERTGWRTDVFYSFFGDSIQKSALELVSDGVRLCLCKCPDAKFMHSPWHEANHKPNGVDFRYIYRNRASWWFCPTWVPSLDTFLEKFNLLGGHIPTTGFAAVLDVLAFQPAEIYCTGFDFFTSGIHNLDEPWRQKNNGDPIGHVPEREAEWFRQIIADQREWAPACAGVTAAGVASGGVMNVVGRITTDEQMHQALAIVPARVANPPAVTPANAGAH